jgi:hypothetical protein
MKRRKKRKGTDKKKITFGAFGVPWSFVFCYQTAVE